MRCAKLRLDLLVDDATDATLRVFKTPVNHFCHLSVHFRDQTVDLPLEFGTRLINVVLNGAEHASLGKLDSLLDLVFEPVFRPVELAFDATTHLAHSVIDLLINLDRELLSISLDDLGNSFLNLSIRLPDQAIERTRQISLLIDQLLLHVLDLTIKRVLHLTNHVCVVQFLDDLGEVIP